jgi:peptide-methionine (S)-S-oxide reductase
MEAFAKGQRSKSLEKATFAAGCFWGVQAAFLEVKGVVSATSGYTGGSFRNPAYEDVCSGKTGHLEAVELEFEPETISYQELLEIFWDIHDPTTADRQGPDLGDQYRSAIFYHNQKQKEVALASKKKAASRFNSPIVTEIMPAGEFYKAEDYHQDYYKKRGITPVCHRPVKNEKKKKDPL